LASGAPRARPPAPGRRPPAARCQPRWRASRPRRCARWSARTRRGFPTACASGTLGSFFSREERGVRDGAVSLFSAGTGRATRDESGGGNTVSRRRDRARALEPGDVARESRGVREIFGAAETNASRRAGTRAIPDLGSYPSQEVGELVRVRRGELADLPRRLVPRSGRRAGLEQAEKPVEPAAPAIVSHDCGRAPRRLKRKADAFPRRGKKRAVSER
jgi:hypothetical protein